MSITRRTWTDDDGSGTTGTILNNAELQRLYDDIDAALLALTAMASLTLSGAAPGTPTAATIYKDSICTAWAMVTISGGTPAITNDFNVASLTDNGAGDTTVNFATALANANFAAQATARAGSFSAIYISAKAVGSVRVFTDVAGSGGDKNFDVAVFGGN